jgi:SH3-like domain-containing protein
VLLFAASCKRAEQKEYLYVSAQQVTLRDRVADVYNRVGVAKNGERLEVLQRTKNKRWVQVRTDDGKIGWVEVRALVEDEVTGAFDKLAADNKNAPVQGHAIVKVDVRLRIKADRDADSLYRVEVPSRETDPNAPEVKVELLRRAVVEKKLPNAPVPVAPPRGKAPAGPALESWWLVRSTDGHVGWVIGRSLDIDVPLDIAQYAEGQLIIASFVLNTVPRSGLDKSPVSQYLVLLSEPRLDQDFDFDQVRVFTWNPGKQRYETAYREHLNGKLPVIVGSADFGKEGVLPTFELIGEDAKTHTSGLRKYKMSGVMVRRADQPFKASSSHKTARKRPRG